MLKIEISGKKVLQKQNLEVLKLFIEEGDNDINLKDNENRTLLHLAIVNNCEKHIIQYLIEKGADLNAEDINGMVPLHYAAEAGQFEIVELLLEHGANLNSTDITNATPLCIAFKTDLNNTNVIELLLDRSCVNNNEKSIFTQTLRYIITNIEKAWNTDDIKALIDRGADVNEKDEENTTLLHVAALQLDIEFIRFLLEYGADVNAEDNIGMTPLHFAAARKDSDDICKLLIQFGANTDVRDHKDKTPLYMAVFFDRKSTVEYFLNKDADTFCTANLIEDLKDKSELVDLIVKRLIKLDVLNLTCHENYLVWKSIGSFNVEPFENMCREEVEKMNDQRICLNRSIKFVDILTKSVQNVSLYINVDEVKQALKNVNLNEHFPIYSDLLRLNIQKAKTYRYSEG